MKCARCGAELKVGSIYCANCGKEAQIVSDSSLLEDELLRQLLQEEDGKKEGPGKPERERQTKKPKKKKNHTPLIISLVCVAVVLVGAAVLAVVIRNNRNNSYEYQVAQAESCVEKRDYAKAMNYYRRALELKEGDIPARFAMAETAVVMEDTNTAIRLLEEILTLDSANEEACRKLIEIYAADKDYESIAELQETVEDEKLLKLFADYITPVPEFSPEPGTYTDLITVELTVSGDCEIYYTTDGGDPTESGTLYEEPFVLEEQGELELRAVARNQYGIYGDEAEGSYVVEFEKPKMAKATPDRGTFTEPVTIELEGPEGCRIYYTWDGTTPTTDSALYTAPIPVPEGNNILSVLLVDKHGMYSDVLKCNYQYYPQE